MNEAPRPLNLGEILDRTISLYRSRFLVFFGISAIPTGVILVIASGAFLFLMWWGANGAGSASPAMASMLAGIFVAVVATLALPVILAVTALASAALTHAVNRAYYNEKIAIRAAYKAVWKRGWQYLWLYLLQALIVWGIPIGVWTGLIVASAFLERAIGGAFAMGGAASGALGAFVMLLGFAALGTYAIWMLLRLSLAFPVCVVEQISAWAALKRSSVLSKGTRWRILALYMLTAVLTWILSFGLAFVVAMVMALIPGAGSPQRAQAMEMTVLFVYYAAGFAMQAFTKPVYGIALVLFYYDQRIRQEGFDIEWMMQRAGLVAPAPAPEEPRAQPWMAADGLTSAPLFVEPPAAADRDLKASEEAQ